MTTPTFDPVGALPRGRVVLEASAGTGKTWAIAALVTRYVAEAGVPIDRILAVTFTRAATSELRHRVRQRLVEAAAAVEAALDGFPTPADPLIAHLVRADPSELRTRRRRLDAAVASFDRAMISTIHGFAGRLLRLLGLLSAAPAHPEVTGDLGAVTDQLINDLVVTEYWMGDDHPIPVSELRRIADSILTNPDAALAPDPPPDDEVAGTRARLAGLIRLRLAERSRASGVIGYDDLLVLARDALTDPQVGTAARAAVRSVFDVALVDEFQDTDRIQWEIVSSVFDENHGTLVIIGDPKQAIYAFRGADVEAYLTAVARSGHQATLGVNWRSDGPVLTALEAVLDGVHFGSGRIRFHPVGPAPGHERSRIAGVAAPMQIRLLSEALRPGHPQLLADPARRLAAGDAAAVVVHLLSGATTIPRRNRPDGMRAIEPSDIAVLCRRNAEIDLVDEELRRRGVPAVKGRTGSVLQTEAALEWFALLEALERPASPAAVKRVLHGPFLGWSAASIATAGEEAMAAEHDRIAGWAGVFRRHGVPALAEEIDRSTGMTARVLRTAGGERLLTDLHHMGEVIHASVRHTGGHSAARWLAAEIARAKTGPEEADTRLRRLETDDQAVQLLTIHTAKGLEFPIVLLPFLWSARPSPRGAIPVFHDPATGRRVIDVGGPGSPGFEESRSRYEAEQEEEDFRLLYVALTRARHHVVLWWAPYRDSARSTLTKVLFGREKAGDAVDPTTQAPVLAHRSMRERLTPILDRSAGTIDVRSIEVDPPATVWSGREQPRPALSAVQFRGAIDAAWWRWSFTGLTEGSHGAGPDTPVPAQDEVGDPELAVGDPLPLGSVRGGVRFGTLVHSVFEKVDFADPDPVEALDAAVADAARRHGLPVDAAEVARGLSLVVDTPLGPRFDDLRLGAVGRGHRLDEMHFEFPVRSPTGQPVQATQIGEALARHLPESDRLRSYHRKVGDLAPAGFHGFLTGAIDLVLRLPDPGGDRRWWVVDYKTNRLPARGEVPSTADYSPEAMAAEMVRSDYVLQALLYQVALHRYLRFRLPGYVPERDLGGALYLFVRGMVGPETPVLDGERTGVLAWGPHLDLVEAVDRLLGGG
jgi:exodeoxyribonuclease V beta subunit